MIYDRTGTVCRHEGAEFRELHASYHENHYLVSLTVHALYISDPVFQKLGDTFLDERLRADLANQIEGWEDLDNLTKEEYLCFISDHQIPERLRNALMPPSGRATGKAFPSVPSRCSETIGRSSGSLKSN